MEAEVGIEPTIPCGELMRLCSVPWLVSAMKFVMECIAPLQYLDLGKSSTGEVCCRNLASTPRPLD